MATKKIHNFLPDDFVPTNLEDWEMLAAIAEGIFNPTAPIDVNRLFAGRIRQISDLLSVIYQPGSHAIIYGERGVGKTSLANIIHERIIGPSKGIKVLKISCSPNDTFHSVWGNVFYDYKYGDKEFCEVVKQRPQPFTVYRLADDLPNDNHYLIILDEFDRILDEETKILIADTIKYLSDNPIKVTIFVVGVGSSIKSLFGSHPSIQRCCQQIQMPRMSPHEMNEIINERLPSLHMTIQKEALEKMAKFSQGLPGYMHLLGMLATKAAINNKSKNITVKHLDSAVLSALEKADESTRRAYYQAIQSTKPDNRYKEVLLACALTEKNELGQFSTTGVCAPYSKIRGKTMGIESFARHLDTFCREDRGPVLVKSGKPKSFMYNFFNPLLEPLVVMKGQSK